MGEFDIVFGDKRIRRAWGNDEWWFSVVDVVEVLSGSVDVKQYIKKMRKRDLELGAKWGTLCTPVESVGKDGKKRYINCANLRGIFRIIQSISSKRAEPFKLWLAKVGEERVEEINDPELAQDRMKAIYEKKGYSKGWIDKRLRGIAVRQDLAASGSTSSNTSVPSENPRRAGTDEWRARGVEEGKDFAILTAEISSKRIFLDELRGLGDG